jgi:hypothetical protein
MKKIIITDADLNEYLYYKQDDEYEIFLDMGLVSWRWGNPESVEIKLEETNRAKILYARGIRIIEEASKEKYGLSREGRTAIGDSNSPIYADIALNIDGVLQGKETTETPQAINGNWKIYSKDNKLYFQDSIGIEHEIFLVP